MTDKEQMIIDGCDVSGCSYGEIEKDIFKCSCEYNVRSASMFCKDNPNCYFKQLARKKQEYEELRQYHNKCCKEFENEKQALLEKYNQNLNNFYNGDYCNTEHCSLLKAKEKECEELKEENQKLEMQLCNDCGERDDYNIPCKMIRDLDYGLQKEIEENDRYRKALEEIEKIVNEPCVADTQEDCKHCDIWCEHKDILNIINKAKAEEDKQ